MSSKSITNITSKLAIAKFSDKPDGNMLAVKGKFADFSIQSHNDSVVIECENDEFDAWSVVLDQIELQYLIQYLQSKVK